MSWRLPSWVCIRLPRGADELVAGLITGRAPPVAPRERRSPEEGALAVAARPPPVYRALDMES